MARKESEMECFRRIKPSEIPISDSVNATALKKILTNPASTERERVIARVLLSPQIQKTITKLTDGLGVETVEKFLKDNEKNIKKNLNQKLKGKDSKKKSKDKKSAQKKVSVDKKGDSEQESDEHSEEEGEESEAEAASDEEMVSEGSSDHEVEKKALEFDEDSNEEPPQKAVKVEKEPTEQKKTSKSKRAMRNAPPPEVKKSADPFFLSSTGENYLATVISEPEEKDESEERRQPKFEKPLDRRQQKFDNKPRKLQGNSKPAHKTSQKPFQASRAAKPEVQPKPKPVQATAADADIHPSWKAKSQMRKVQIQDFQGTKIKFDD